LKTLILLSGLPGSGKTTFYDKVLAARYNYHLIRLSMDDLRRQITGQDFFPAAESIVHSWLDLTGQYLLEHGYSFLIDTTSLSKNIRLKWVQLAKKYGYVLKCFWLSTPPADCLERNKKRARFVPQDVILKMASTLQIPSFDEGYDDLIFVSTYHNFFQEESQVKE